MMRTPDAEVRHTKDGENMLQRVYRFPNGYGASVVKGYIGDDTTHGSDEGLWELAVVRFHGPRLSDFSVDESTPITADAPKDEEGVCGRLNEATVDGLLQLIEKLEPPKS